MCSDCCHQIMAQKNSPASFHQLCCNRRNLILNIAICSGSVLHNETYAETAVQRREIHRWPERINKIFMWCLLFSKMMDWMESNKSPSKSNANDNHVCIVINREKFHVTAYNIKPFLSSSDRVPHSLIAASRIAPAAWNLAFANWEFSATTETTLIEKPSKHQLLCKFWSQQLRL